MFPATSDRSKPLRELMANLKEYFSADETKIYTGFRDAYSAMIFFVSDTGNYRHFMEYDSEAIPAMTISLISAMTAFSEHEPAELETMTQLWVSTLEAVIRIQPPYEARSHQSWMDAFLRMFIGPPEWEDAKEEVATQMTTLVPALIETSSTYYVLQRLVSEYYFEIGCGFHTEYINCMTLGLSCFLRITHRHPKQQELVTSFMTQQTKMNLSTYAYYDDPNSVLERYVFRVK
jgi:hypothetical protein